MKVGRRQTTPRKVLNYRRANFVCINEDLEIMKETHDTTSSTETQWKKIKDTIILTTKRHIPSITNKNRLNPAWIDAEVIHESHRKSCALNKSEKSNKPEDKARFKRIRNNLENLVTGKLFEI